MGLLTDYVGGVQERGAIDNYTEELIKGGNAGVDTVNQGVKDANNVLHDGTVNAVAGNGAAVEKANAGLEPYLSGGTDAFRSLANLVQNPKEFEFNQDDPSFQFRLNEGAKALERSAAAKGTLMGGRFAKELTRYSQDYASTEYGKAFDRFRTSSQARINNLSGVAKQGQAAAEQTGFNGIRGSEMQGGWMMNDSIKRSSNELDRSEYEAGTRVEQYNARGNRNLGRAGSWNRLLSNIGKRGDAASRSAVDGQSLAKIAAAFAGGA